MNKFKIRTLAKITICILLMGIGIPETQAQNNKIEKIGKKIGNKFKRKGEQTADKKIDEGIDKVFKDTEEAVEEIGKDNPDKKKKDEQVTTKDKSSPSSNTATSGEAGGVSSDAPTTPTTSQKEPIQTEMPGTPTSKEKTNKEVAPFPNGNFAKEKADFGVFGKGPFGSESGLIITETHTKNSMATIHQFDTLVYASYGGKQARRQWQKQEVDFMGIKNKQISHNIIYVNKDSMHNADMTKRTGVSMGNPFTEFYEGITEEQANKLASDIEQGGTIKTTQLGTERLHGVICEVVDANVYDENGVVVMRIRSWNYKGHILKSITKSDDINMTTNALYFKEGGKIDSRQFKKLPGIRYTTMDLNNIWNRKH